jgi:hypothetical protein
VTVSGNFIGTKATGIVAIQNGLHGVSSYTSNPIIGGDGTETLVTLPAVGPGGGEVRTFGGLPQLTHVYVNDPSIGPDEYVITVEVADDDQPESPASYSQTITVARSLSLWLNRPRLPGSHRFWSW